jgi:hypothetical protein
MIRYRPLRSPAFWLGLWILLFLLWAWKDSMHWRSRVFIPASAFEISASSGRNAVGFAINRTKGIWLRCDGYDYVPLTEPCIYREELSEWIDPPGPWIAAVSTDSPLEEVFVLTFAWWFIILLHLILWGCLVAWRWKRAMKLASQNELSRPTV